MRPEYLAFVVPSHALNEPQEFARDLQCHLEQRLQSNFHSYARSMRVRPSRVGSRVALHLTCKNKEMVVYSQTNADWPLIAAIINEVSAFLTLITEEPLLACYSDEISMESSLDRIQDRAAPCFQKADLSVGNSIRFTGLRRFYHCMCEAVTRLPDEQSFFVNLGVSCFTHEDCETLVNNWLTTESSQLVCIESCTEIVPSRLVSVSSFVGHDLHQDSIWYQSGKVFFAE